MRSQDPSFLDAEWRRPSGASPWFAAAAGPVAWLAHLLGASTAASLAICVLGLVVGTYILHVLRVRGDRSYQRSWFLAQSGVTMAVVGGALVMLEAIG